MSVWVVGGEVELGAGRRVEGPSYLLSSVHPDPSSRSAEAWDGTGRAQWAAAVMDSPEVTLNQFLAPDDPARAE